MFLLRGIYTNSYSITFKHNMSLGIFFRNGPLAIAVTVTTETSQMKLDKPQRKTSVLQSH